MKPWFEMTRVEFHLFTRNFPSLFFSLGFPAMMLLIFGGVYGNKPSPLFGGYGTVDVSIPAYTALIIATTGIMTLPLAVAGYREGGVLKRLKASPMAPTDLLVSQILVNVAMTVVGMLVLVLVGVMVFDLRFQGHLGPTVLSFFLSTLSIYALGYLIASLVPGTKACTAIANIVFFPMLFLTGATVPLEIMPENMVTISKFLPLTYAVRLMKGAWLGGSLTDFGTEILFLGALAVVSIVGAVATFRWE